MSTITTFLLYWISLTAMVLILVASIWALGWIAIYLRSALSNWSRHVSRFE